MSASPAPRKIAVVVTTISDGRFLKSYERAIREEEMVDRVTLYVIGDLNTPAACQGAAQAVASEGIDCRYFDMEGQERFMRRFPEMSRLIPERSDERRNVGYLMAFADRADVVISVDDDNLPTPGGRFFATHAEVGLQQRLPVAESPNGWFNLAGLLETTDFSGSRITIHPRGFPYARRGPDQSRVGTKVESGRVAVNAGLWSGDPDVDAITRLATRCLVTPTKIDPFLLGQRQRCPINSQNTAVDWFAMPAYYFVLMNRPVGDVRIGRFGDIFSGYFLQVCADAVGDRVRMGTPWVHQDRNRHDLLKDLWGELPGISLIDDMADFLEDPLPPASSYVDAYRELAERLRVWSHGQRGRIWNAATVTYIGEVAAAMDRWGETCVALAGGAAALRVPSAVTPA